MCNPAPPSSPKTQPTPFTSAYTPISRTWYKVLQSTCTIVSQPTPSPLYVKVFQPKKSHFLRRTCHPMHQQPPAGVRQPWYTSNTTPSDTLFTLFIDVAIVWWMPSSYAGRYGDHSMGHPATTRRQLQMLDGVTRTVRYLLLEQQRLATRSQPKHPTIANWRLLEGSHSDPDLEPELFSD